jgi:hypothetical protein
MGSVRRRPSGKRSCGICWCRTAAPVTDFVRGTGDLGVVVERADGALLIVDTTERRTIDRVEGLGDLSHASVVFSRDARYAFVFGRDGGLSKVDLLTAEVTHRVMQAGNSIGGAISQDGRIVAVANYEPGGVNFYATDDLEPLAEMPATYGPMVPAPRWWGSRTCRTTASSSASTTPARSGLCAPRRNGPTAIRALPDVGGCPTTPDHP